MPWKSLAARSKLGNDTPEIFAPISTRVLTVFDQSCTEPSPHSSEYHYEILGRNKLLSSFRNFVYIRNKVLENYSNYYN